MRVKLAGKANAEAWVSPRCKICVTLLSTVARRSNSLGSLVGEGQSVVRPGERDFKKQPRPTELHLPSLALPALLVEGKHSSPKVHVCIIV